jgi:hypothetical protein
MIWLVTLCLACLGGFLTLCERVPVMDNEQ